MPTQALVDPMADLVLMTEQILEMLYIMLDQVQGGAADTDTGLS